MIWFRRIDMSKILRFLLVRTDRIGDVALAMPVASAIKADRPDAHVALLARSYTRIIGERNPDIDEVITIDNEDGSLRNFSELVRCIRQKQFECAVVIHPTFYCALLPACARIKVRIGTAYRFYSSLFNYRHREHRKISEKHEVEYNLGLLKPLKISCSDPQFKFELNNNDKELAENALREAGIESGSRFCVINPGCSGSSYNWQLESYGETASLFVEELKLPVIVTWGPGEEAIADGVVHHSSGKVLKLPEVLPLPAQAALMQKADFVLAPSTGILHLANAIGAEVIGLYPPIPSLSPRRWGPYGKLENTIVPESNSNLFSIKIRKLGQDCMKLITPAMVLLAAQKVLQKKTGIKKKLRLL